jgi:hypothetical protein
MHSSTPLLRSFISILYCSTVLHRQSSHVPAQVLCELWVEGCGQQGPLPHSNCHTLAPTLRCCLLLTQLVLRQHLNLCGVQDTTRNDDLFPSANAMAAFAE